MVLGNGFRCRSGRCETSLFGFDNNTALLAPVTDLPCFCRFYRFKIIVLSAMYLVTLGTVPLVQIIGIDGQMAVAAPQHIFLVRQQSQGKVSA